MNFNEYLSQLTEVGSLMSRRAFDDAVILCQRVREAVFRDAELDTLEQRELDVELLRVTADIYSSQGNDDKAEEYLVSALELLEGYDFKDTRAKVLGTLGNNHLRNNRFAKALEYYQASLEILESSNNTVVLAGTYSNIGTIFLEIADFSSALEWYTRALAKAEEAQHKRFTANILTNLGHISHKFKQFESALSLYQRAAELDKELLNRSELANTYNSQANSYRQLEQFDQAIELYKQSLSICESIQDHSTIALIESNIGSLYSDLKRYDEALEYMMRALRASIETNDVRQMATIYANIGRVQMAEDNPLRDEHVSEEYFLKALSLLEHHDMKLHLYDCHEGLFQLYQKQQRWEEALRHHVWYVEAQSEMYSEESRNRLQHLEHQRAIESAERDRQLKLARFHEQEKILHNILPAAFANRVVSGERRIVESYQNVSILFADIVGFTTISATQSPSELASLLDDLFSRLDELCSSHGCEKIKTIGDCYMAVCGMPEACDDHAERIAALAEEIRALEIQVASATHPSIVMRIGLHCGSVVGGVLGRNKYSFDVWGDAVNLAARMESNGEAGKIHCTAEFKGALEARQLSSKLAYSFVDRGHLDIKGKGTMRTYFLNLTTLHGNE